MGTQQLTRIHNVASNLKRVHCFSVEPVLKASLPPVFTVGVTFFFSSPNLLMSQSQQDGPTLGKIRLFLTEDLVDI